MKAKRIALVGFRLSGGGSDKVMANLSKFFHSEGLNVHIIIFHDELGYEYSGTVFNLGKIKSESNTLLNKIKRFYAFKTYIKKQQFDYIIDFRFRIHLLQEILISKWIYKTKAIYTVHSSSIKHYMPESSFFTRYIYGDCNAMVAINKQMKTIIEDQHQLKNMTTIYNPVSIPQLKQSDLDDVEINTEFIIGVGQYDTNVKQFDKLIEAYAQSVLPEKNTALVILGTGQLKAELIKIADSYNLSHLVHLLGFKSNPYKYMAKAKFYVLTSQFEGFPMVLIEALACKTPVVAFDCLTGPSEIIQNKKNGILVENQNTNQLIKAMNVMITDTKLYENCKLNAEKSIENYTLDVIGKQWLDLMKHN